VRAGRLVFALEGAFVAAVPVLAWAAGLKPAWIIVSAGGAWLVAAIADGLLARGRQGVVPFVPPVRFSVPRPAQQPPPAPEFDWPTSAPEEIAPDWLESAEILGVRVSGFEPASLPENAATLVVAAEAAPPQVSPANARPRRSRLPRRLAAPARRGVPRPAPAEPAVAIPSAAELAWPSRSAEPVVPERLCTSCGQPISAERLLALPEATQCIDCKREGRPESSADAAAPPPAETGEWNVLELEQLARGLGGEDAAREEELASLLVYLREFANPEGQLPPDFDALVRESFPELVSASGPA
jgi:hypothetical protein